jgi:hypothetical protein
MDKQPYTTVMHGGSGFFAALISWYEEDNMWDITNTGVIRSKHRKEAEEEAKDWAKAEGIEYKG